MDVKEDPLARMHREYRDQCIRLGKYRPITDEELNRAIARWRAECNRPPKKTKKRKHQPKALPE